MQPLWLLDSIGSRLIIDEQQAFSDLSTSSFGNYFLQLGMWGQRNTFFAKTPIKNCFLIATQSSGEIDLVTDLDCLPLQEQTIDLVFLPHTLEQCKNHQEVLNSSTNAIKESGTLIALGFNPIWYGVLYTITCQFAYMTPPFLYNLFLIALALL